MLHLIWSTFAVIGLVSCSAMIVLIVLATTTELRSETSLRKELSRKARHCVRCGWMGDADIERSGTGAKLWDSICDDCLNKLADVPTDG